MATKANENRREVERHKDSNIGNITLVQVFMSWNNQNVILNNSWVENVLFKYLCFPSYSNSNK